MSRNIVLAALLITVLSPPAWAQYRPPAMSSQPLEHKLEITPFGGYSWTFSRRVSIAPPVDATGDLDIKDNAFWGIEVDVTLQPGAQLALLYSRQESDLTFKQVPGGITRDITGVSVEYFQIGGIGGIKQGPSLPYGMLTLGATRIAYKDLLGADDTWKFSVILGFGVKYYAAERIGLRAQVRMPFTFFSGGAGIGCGFQGCYTTVGGSGVAQIDVGLGLMILM
jgi:hypothetical protein